MNQLILSPCNAYLEVKTAGLEESVCGNLVQGGNLVLRLLKKVFK